MVSDYLKVVTYFVLSFTNINFFHDSIFHESEIRTVLLEVSIDLGLLKKSLLKTSKIVLLYSNSLARHFSSMVHAKCLLPRLDRLLLVRSCLQNFYQCSDYFDSNKQQTFFFVKTIMKISKNKFENSFSDPVNNVRFFSQSIGAVCKS